MHASMPTHVAEHAETATTALKSARKGLFAGVTVEVDLQTTGAIETLSAVVALVFE